MPDEHIHILIVEDESIVALDLATGLQHEGYHIVGIADHAEEAKTLFTSHQVDLLLMDIHIRGEKDGVETAKELMAIKQVPLIYLTAYTDHETIQRVKQTYPAAFLSKPYDIHHVRIAIELALNNFALYRQRTGKMISLPSANTDEARDNVYTNPTQEKESILQYDEFIFIKQNYRFIKIRTADILYASADDNYVHLHTNDKKYSLRIPLAQLIEKIQSPQLVRIHRSYAVNLQAIQSFTEQEVVINKQHLPIGRNYKEDFLKNFYFR
ncbi:LytR/AlgR family response regulator transcription factor [Thermoflavifilum thermophilum]|uniref:Two component transcriptional regulator, LytTR family n=1 Tax=Thermoflavifilum thermophilum TaxID=1393122 RepID=A0A1I7NDH5_9BACT|nr:LytTR family transcriptional regulator DNA-binding domain-containing protein [Thermoflavifilum thermophilum]SFV32737.1 two component transcriptional regulator, LytTR family [Thermoflavifilum thermophilum]